MSSRGIIKLMVTQGRKKDELKKSAKETTKKAVIKKPRVSRARSVVKTESLIKRDNKCLDKKMEKIKIEEVCVPANSSFDVIPKASTFLVILSGIVAFFSLVFMGLTLNDYLKITGIVTEPSINSVDITSNNKGVMVMGCGSVQENCGEDLCLADECLVSNMEYPVSDISGETADALQAALDQEYKAYAFYNAAVETFGSTRPFIMILRSEEQHISAIKALEDKYGIIPDENKYINKAEIPETLYEACKSAIDIESGITDFYTKELGTSLVTSPDIRSVFNVLNQSSKERHLPAFEQCGTVNQQSAVSN